MSIFVVLPIVAVAIALWPVLGTNYRGMPIAAARLITLLGFALSVLVFERTLVLAFQFLTGARSTSETSDEFTPAIGRRALILGGLGLVIAGGGVAVLRKLYRAATFSYDGTQYKGRVVQPITPNDLFYCVTKNVIDPKVDVDLWHLEVNGLVQNPATYRFEDVKGFSAVEQETTLMCISNAVGDGLMSNAKWKGIPLRSVLEAAGPGPGVVKAVLRGTDSYSDTIAIAKAMDPATLLAFEMNGDPLPLRHGYPVRVIVPGLFGEKNVKWVSRVELVDHDAKGFYESQGWGPSFVVPTHSRFDVPDDGSRIAAAPTTLRGIAFAGARGIRSVEVSLDAGRSWRAARIDHPGTTLTWALWSYDWRPEPGAVEAVVRATDGDGALQIAAEHGTIPEGSTGYHRIRFMVA